MLENTQHLSELLDFSVTLFVLGLDVESVSRVAFKVVVMTYANTPTSPVLIYVNYNQSKTIVSISTYSVFNGVFLDINTITVRGKTNVGS